jgi:hypothetical protein
MAANLAALRTHVELSLTGRVAAPFSYRDRKFVETVSSGIPEIDSLTGGLPRGSLTEICGPPCSGRSTLLVSALAERTAHAEVCALVDGRDAFDPESALAAGVELQKLLWVRCRNIDQAFRATDLLLQGGGFGFIAVDLSDLPQKTVRHIPLNAWFRFRRTVENTPTILMVFEQETNAKTCASLVLRLNADAAYWVSTAQTYDEQSPVSHSVHSLTNRFDGFGIRAELVCSRIESVNKLVARTILHDFAHSAKSNTGFFESKIIGNFLDGISLPSPVSLPAATAPKNSKPEGVLQLR